MRALRHDTRVVCLRVPHRHALALVPRDGSIEGSHAHLKVALQQALLLRGSGNFADLDAYFEEELVTVTRSGGFFLRRIFYTVSLSPDRPSPSGQLRVYDDRLGMLPRWHTGVGPCDADAPAKDGNRSHVVDYHHVIHALRRKPMALLNLVYRDQLFPHAGVSPQLGRAARRAAAAHGLSNHGRLARPGARSRTCEGELAVIELEAILGTGELPDLALLRQRIQRRQAR